MTTYRSLNPADRSDVVAEVDLVDVDGVVDAARAAHGAQRSWASTPAPVRGKAIANLGRLLEANLDALAGLITREVGKVRAEAVGEVQEAIDTCQFFLSEGRRLYGMTVPSEMPDKALLTYRNPVGTALIITAGNFPVAVPSWYLVPALLCGNTVVWKPAEYAAACAEAFAELVSHAGFPEDALRLVHADGATTSAGLERALELGLVAKVGFTGSTDVGRSIGALCGAHLQAPCLELGGKNPMVVAPDADIALAVEGALFSGFGTAGQRCTSLGTVFVHRSVHDEFLSAYTDAVSVAAIGDPNEQVLYGPMIDERFHQRFLGWLDLIDDHHRVSGSDHLGTIDGSHPRRGFIGDPTKGWYCHPTIVDGVRSSDALYSTETFGPIVGVATYDHLDEAIELANGHGYGLSSSIYTSDPATAFRFRERVSAGMVSINNSTTGAEAHLPFGGNGLSGNGSRQSGVWVLDQFTRWQAVNWDYSGHLQKAQMDVADVSGQPDFRL